MGATKFLRKRSKLILIIGGALLMVAWLVPQMLQQLGRNPANTQYMRIDGRKISALQADQARRRIYASLQLMGGRGLADIGVKNLAHWLLLLHEAHLHGLIGGPADGRELIENSIRQNVEQQIQFAAMLGQTPPPREQALAQARANFEAARAAIARDARLTVEEVDQALADLRGVMRLRNLAYGSAARLSDRRTIPEALRQDNQATVDYVFIPADVVLDQIPEPDDATLAAHLERFRDVRPTEGAYGIGYLLPPRVKVEWLVIDREQIASAVRVSRVEVMERYQRENPDASGTISAEKRAEIENQLRKEAADRIVAEAEKAVRAEFARSLRRLEKSGDHYILPDDWDAQRPDLHKVRDAVVEAARRVGGGDIPAPTVEVRAADWLTAQDLSALPGIGRSFMQRGTQRIPFSTAALSVPEAGGPGDLGIQARVPGAMTRDFADNLYFWTVLDGRPESPPSSMEEIRDRLAREKRRLDAYEVLVRDAEVYRLRAANEGLEVVSLPPLGYPQGRPTPQMRRAATISRRNMPFGHDSLRDESVRDAILDAAERLDPTQDIASVPVDARTLAVPVPSQLGLAIVQITAFRPLTAEQYRQRDMSIVMDMSRDALNPDDDPFSLDRLAARHNAELPRDREGEDS